MLPEPKAVILILSCSTLSFVNVLWKLKVAPVAIMSRNGTASRKATANTVR
ncbi:MAG: hypothetical protein MUC62_06920 [Candidatus Thermoplasmatota archaeon]|nr:hypothetical protein [Candidatus Thermoplasmatota archaeon]